MTKDIVSLVAELQEKYKRSNSSEDKDRLYEELLKKYEIAQKRIKELEAEKNTSKLPSKDEVDAMSGMLDLISKLDESTIEKLNKFGGKGQ